MSKQYPGGIISKTAPTPSGPYNTSTAPGVWTLEQQAYWQKLGQWPTQGNVNPNAFIENLFSTYLYTGNGSTQTITNGINLSTNGGLVWMKARNGGSIPHYLIDTSAYKVLNSNNTNAGGSGYYPTYFNPTSSGFFIDESAGWFVNTASTNFVSWTFRKQAKFFDVVTYTGTGSVRTVSHNLGSAPGFMVIKRTDSADEWFCYHTSLGAGSGILLNQTFASFSAPNYFNSTAPTSTVFTLGTDSGLNANGGSFVAYLFANNAGGFGLTGTDNVISCGSYTGNGSTTGPVITLGYEPQWLMVKKSSGTGDWVMVDNMRGIVTGGVDPRLWANLSSAENTGDWLFQVNATGFQPESLSDSINASGQTYIYIAIRRGPMAVPTSGTSVFSPYVTNTVAASSSGSTSTSALYRSDFVTDFVIQTQKAFVGGKYAVSRLTGNQYLLTNSTAAEGTSTVPWDSNIAALNFAADYGQWMFRRAPGFFDAVCYTGTGSTGQVVNHNLAATPEMVIIKRRDGTFNWFVYQTGLSYGNSIYLNQNSAQSNDGGPAFALTSTTITFDRTYVSNLNTSGGTYVAYLFATCAGVSKVGSYTGTGATQTISCGFTGGARFVLVKRTDSTGDWYVWDTARGMVSGTDPSLLLNSTAAEVNANSIYTTTGGFQIVSTAAGINASGGTYIFLAIA